MMQARNLREAQLEELKEEVGWLREKAGVKQTDGVGIDLSKLRLKSQVGVRAISARSPRDLPAISARSRRWSSSACDRRSLRLRRRSTRSRRTGSS